MKNISVCTVIMEHMQDYLGVFLDSLTKYNSGLREVILVQTDGDFTGLIKEGIRHDVLIKTFGFPVAKSIINPVRKAWVEAKIGHALGLHHALSHAKGDFILFSDPDIVFHSDTTALYQTLIQDEKLDIVGVSHFTPDEECYWAFPCVINCMVKKESLPPKDWLQGRLFFDSDMEHEGFKILPMDGKYLIPGRIDPELFENPEGRFDCGCNLYRWAIEQGWEWLGFTCKGNEYSRGHFTLSNSHAAAYGDWTMKDPFEKLLYHQTLGGRNKGELLKEYCQANGL